MRTPYRSFTVVWSLLVLLAYAPALTPAFAEQFGSTGEGLSNGGGLVPETQSEQLLQQLGIPEQQLWHLREQSASGAMGNFENQRLCASMAAKHFSSDQARSIGRNLGLSDDDLERLVKCVRISSGEENQTRSRLGSEGMRNRLVPEGPSSIEHLFHAADTPYKLLEPPDLSKLKQFGYELFSNDTRESSGLADVPVNAEYVVGPGDELNVLLWGRINRTLRLTVQRDGTVLIPQIGPLAVAGLSFAQVRQLISSQAGQIEGVQADVTVGRLRTIQVFVIGQVVEPGPHTVSALAHVSDALTAAEGVRKTGSLRRIELRRDNHLIGTIDLYATLLHGDTSADQRLQARDVIFVPVIGPVVAMAGNVRNPAIYELKGRETLDDAVRMAGGVSAFGYAQRIQVERVQNHQQRIALDAALETPQTHSFAVGDGDLVKVFTVLPEQGNVVKLEGNVNRPGKYQYEPGMRVADLVRHGQGVRDRTFFEYALLKRREGPTRTTHYLRVDLETAISNQTSSADTVLEPGDTLTIYSEGEINELPTVSIAGEVRKPGTYPLTDGMRIKDLVYEAGGLKQDAYVAKVQMERTLTDGSSVRYLYKDVDLKGALDGNTSANDALHVGDALFITQTPNWHTPWVVQVKGEAMQPGPYVIHEGERLGSVLERCGGVRSDGYLRALILLRKSVKEMQKQNLQRASAQLQTELTKAALMPAESKEQQPNLQQKAEALTMLKNMITQNGQDQAIGRIVLNVSSVGVLPGSSADVPLEDKDEIIVPRRPSSVNVMGEVYGPTAIAYEPRLTVAQYIDRAGGLTEDADKEQIFVVKANGAIVSTNGFREAARNRMFPLLPMVSGGLIYSHLEPGDTIYVPANFLFVNPLQRTLDITQIIANSAQGIAYAALLGTLLP